MADRFVVTEVKGYVGREDAPGVSCMVVDTLYNRQLIATYRSEDVEDEEVDGRIVRLSARGRIEAVRRRAKGHAIELNLHHAAAAS